MRLGVRGLSVGGIVYILVFRAVYALSEGNSGK